MNQSLLYQLLKKDLYNSPLQVSVCTSAISQASFFSPSALFFFCTPSASSHCPPSSASISSSLQPSASSPSKLEMRLIPTSKEAPGSCGLFPFSSCCLHSLIFTRSLSPSQKSLPLSFPSSWQAFCLSRACQASLLGNEPNYSGGI